MRLSLLRSQVRYKIRQPAGANSKWDNDVLDSHINTIVRDLYRRRTDADSSYGLVQLAIPSTSHRVEQVGDHYRYHLPSYIHVVQGVRLGTAELPGEVLGPLFEGSERRGYRFDSDLTIALPTFAEPQDLLVRASRYPSSAHAGVCAVNAAGANEVPFEAEATIANWDSEEGAYVGAQIELTGGGDATRDPRGRVSTITAHTSAWDATLPTPGFLTKALVAPAPAAQAEAGDTYEIHVPIQVGEARFVTLLVAQSLWEEDKNTAALNAIRGELERQEVAWIDAIQPRQDQEPWMQGGVGAFVGPGGAYDRDPIWSGSAFSIYF